MDDQAFHFDLLGDNLLDDIINDEFPDDFINDGDAEDT